VLASRWRRVPGPKLNSAYLVRECAGDVVLGILCPEWSLEDIRGRPSGLVVRGLSSIIQTWVNFQIKPVGILLIF
jgi:hypothetical protein